MPVLHFWDESPPARTVLLLIRYLELDDIQIERLDLNKWQSDEFLKLNPARKIPVLVDGDFILSESTAICQYLYEKSGSDKPIFGRSGLENVKERAIVMQRICYNIATMFQKLYNLSMPLYNKVTDRIEENLKKESWHEYEVLDKLLEGNEWAAGSYVTLADFGLLATVSSFQHPLYLQISSIIEPEVKEAIWHEYNVFNQLLTGKKWAAGDYVTLADFGLLSTIESLRAINFDTANYPNITKWLKNCETIPGFDENKKGAQMFGNNIKQFAPTEFE